jgi:hypothetical protein
MSAPFLGFTPRVPGPLSKEKIMWQAFLGWIVAWACAASMLTELLQGS